ncbi:unnamed protein product [Staurois parvus]|uniref:Uncharacterized protein n=1 Tax=Staurois parvus TaxID=386267 RepID=A0ABN9FZU3_9NEOB|nr:unnamed protein product [Staurois parvus]
MVLALVAARHTGPAFALSCSQAPGPAIALVAARHRVRLALVAHTGTGLACT